jgi:hypothetical protein
MILLIPPNQPEALASFQDTRVLVVVNKAAGRDERHVCTASCSDMYCQIQRSAMPNNIYADRIMRTCILTNKAEIIIPNALQPAGVRLRN